MICGLYLCVDQLSAVFEIARNVLYSAEVSYFSVARCSQCHHSIHVEDTTSHQGARVFTRISITVPTPQISRRSEGGRVL